MNKLITLGTVSGETKTLKQEAVIQVPDGQEVLKDTRVAKCTSGVDVGEVLPQCQG